MKKSDQIKVGCVILAAGNSTRFGVNKLFALIDGRSMIDRAFDAVPAERLSDIVVVTQYDSIAVLAEERGFRAVINSRPDLGLSRSVMLGTEALKDRCDGIIYQAADQPRLKRGSVSEMIDMFRGSPDRIVCMSSAGRRGNPCIFPRKYFDELLALSGDSGGRSVIGRHGDDVMLFEASEAELKDIDTPEDISE